MRRVRILALALLSTLLLDAPRRAEPPAAAAPQGPPTASCGDVRADVTAVTWNAGLAPGMVALSTPRAPRVAAAVAATDFDLLCMQEVWTEPERRAVLDALALPPQRTLVFDTTGLMDDGVARCDAGRLSSLVECAERECGSSPEEEQTLCALHACERQLLTIYFTDRQCLDCLTAGVGRGVRAIAAACEGEGMSRVYGGANGVILASRWRLYEKDVMMLPGSGANRVALFARVEVPGRGPVEVACTHVSAPQRVSPDRSGFDDWQDEQIAQVRLIAERLRERATDGAPQLLLGDLNAGPDLGPVEASSERAWDEIVRLGFSSPAAEARPPFCSLCQGNTLRGNYAGHLVDHVLVFDPPGGGTLSARCADRLFDRPEVIAGHAGEPVWTDLSDHYAVRVRLDLR